MKIVDELGVVIDNLIESLNKLTESELNKIPFANSWTAGQMGDHLLKSFSAWKILKGDSSEPKRPYDPHCKPLSDLFLNFQIKMVAEPSDFNYPTNDYISKTALLANIKQVAGDIIQFARNNDLAKLCLEFEVPTLGYLTRYEWLHFYKVHTQRHIHQLRNIIDNLNVTL